MAGGGGAAIFLHLNHLLFPIVIIVALHWTGYLYDLARSMDAREAFDEFHKNDKPKLTAEQKEKIYPKLWFTGMLWSVVVGLLGIAALVVFVLSFVFQLPKVVQWYYLVAAIFALLFASLGLGYNRHVDAFDKCMAVTPSPEQVKFNKENKLPPPEPPKTRNCVGDGKLGALASADHLMWIFALSFAHALTYVAAFLLTLCDGSSSSGGGSFNGGGGGNRGGYQDQAAREQEERDQKAREQAAMSPTSTTTDVEAAQG